MSKITIKNNRPGGFGIPGGPVIEAGASLDVELSDWAAVEGHPVVQAWVDAGHLTIEGRAATQEGDDDEFKAPFEAKDKGAGWWAIYDADGKEVKSLRKDDAEIFNALSDADKAAEVAKK
ncbi:hypothetical protein [Shinella sp.]|uniref:hypothetical protein n=1 Tax=Shinella sp. TaxID=1870904 RepID=UPI003D2AE0CE